VPTLSGRSQRRPRRVCGCQLERGAVFRLRFQPFADATGKCQFRQWLAEQKSQLLRNRWAVDPGGIGGDLSFGRPPLHERPFYRV
jgi:hypothetical protein